MAEDSSTSERMKEIMKKFVSPNSKPTMETFPELVDCVIWLRFTLALSFGLWIGTHPNRGGGGNVLVGLNLITFPPIFYCQTFLGADPASYGGKLFLSGVVQGLALALLIWIYLYTKSHETEEAALALALSKLLVGEDVTLSDVVDDTGITEDSEF